MRAYFRGIFWMWPTLQPRDPHLPQGCRGELFGGRIKFRAFRLEPDTPIGLIGLTAFSGARQAQYSEKQSDWTSFPTTADDNRDLWMKPTTGCILVGGLF